MTDIQPESRVEKILVEMISGIGGGSSSDESSDSDDTIIADGKTHFLIYIDPVAPSNRRDFSLRWSQTESNNAVIDWGDGSSVASFSDSGYAVSHSHTYSDAGWYNISISVESGTIIFEGSSGSNGYAVYGSKGNSNAYNRNRIRKIIFGTGVSGIGDYAFYNCCGLTSISMGNVISTIGAYAFGGNCDGLTKITIPATVTTIGNSAFEGCNGVSEYHVLSTTPATLSNTSVFDAIQSDSKIYVPNLDSYQNATNWASLASYMEEESV